MAGKALALSTICWILCPWIGSRYNQWISSTIIVISLVGRWNVHVLASHLSNKATSKGYSQWIWPIYGPTPNPIDLKKVWSSRPKYTPPSWILEGYLSQSSKMSRTYAIHEPIKKNQKLKIFKTLVIHHETLVFIVST